MTDLQPDHLASVPSRLGVRAEFDDGGLRIIHHPNPTTTVHGAVRASVAAYVVDAVAGIVVDDDPDAWSLTTDLSVRLGAATAPAALVGTTEVLRRGRRSTTSRVDLVDERGCHLGSGAASFVRVPRRPDDPPKPQVSPADAPELFRQLGSLDGPLREEVGVEVVDAAEGVVRVVVRPELCNAAGTLQGAMVALIAEAAAEELAGARSQRPVVVTELDVRYLAQASEGVVRTRSMATGDGPDAPVEVEIVHEASGAVLTHAYARSVPRET